MPQESSNRSGSVYRAYIPARANVIEAERDAFKPFVQQGQLAAIIYYTWSGTPTKVDPMGIYRCGALTEAGKAALSP
jgi:hypothetical protein